MPRADIPLDRLDLRLLACLQGESRLTHAELGSKIGLSSTAVLRRIRRLRDQGVN